MDILDHIADYIVSYAEKDNRTKALSKQFYDKKNVGDTIILQVSKEYPLINKVHNWNPDSIQIAKYKNSNK